MKRSDKSGSRLRKLALLALPPTVAAIALGYLNFAGGSRPAGPPPSDSHNALLSSPEEEALPADITEEELSALMGDPRVQTYLERERDKEILEEYFNGDGGDHSDERVWELIETIEGQGRVMAYEGLALKLAWLERNSANSAEFDAAARALVEEYRAAAKENAEQYDPYEDVPGFAEYKSAEERIVREVQQMESFPDGMNRQEYLRQRLQAAREKAYSRAEEKI